MGKVIAICGKVCSGKSYYSQQLKDKENAVILSCDEITNILFDNNLGDKHDEISQRIRQYLLKKAKDIIATNTNVILDWGFWSRKDREYVINYFKVSNIVCECHYIEVDDKTWEKNIEERNKRVLEGNGGSDFYLDGGLREKLLLLWEEPTQEEVDVWYKLKR